MGSRGQGRPTIRIGAGPARAHRTAGPRVPGRGADPISAEPALSHIPPENAKVLTSVEHTP
ncbi:hypothetical protein SUDANB126_00346 [Streptomyces sp. enrichment culture]